MGRLSLATAVALVAATAGSVRAAPRTEIVPVLIYHHVKSLKPSDDAIERGLTILPNQFLTQMQKLRRAGYHTVSAAQVVSSLRTGARLPANPVAITFDDGYTDQYTNVYPVLRRLHMTATFFIVPGFLDTPRYMTWAQVLELQRHGMDIEAHTLTHPDLTMLSAAARWHEIDGSRLVLQQRLHRQIRVLAYPYGAYDAAVVSDVARAGFYGAFTTHQGWELSSAHLLTLPRVYSLHSNSVWVAPNRILSARIGAAR